MNNKQIIKKSGLYLIGNLSAKILSVLLIPIYAFYVNSYDLGTYDYSQTIMNMVVPIIFVAIWEAIIRFVLSEDDGYNLQQVITSTLIFVVTIAVISSIIMITIGTLINISNFGLTILMILSNGTTMIWQYYARAMKKNTIYVRASIWGTITNFIFNIIFICILKIGLLGLYLSYILGQLSILISIEYNIRIINKVKLKYFDGKLLIKMLEFSAPLVLNLISLWAISGFGKVIITNKLGNSVNGLYSFSNKFGMIITLLGSVIAMALIEEAILSKKDANFGKSFSKTINNLFSLFQSIIIVAIPCIYIFYNFISSTEYYKSIEFFYLFMIYAFFMTMSTNVGSALQAIDKTKYQFITTVIGAFTTIIISYTFIDKFNIYAVIWAQIIGAFIMLLSRYILIKKFMYFKIFWIPIIIKMLILFIFIEVCKISSLVMLLMIAIISAVSVAILNRNILKSIIQKRKR